MGILHARWSAARGDRSCVKAALEYVIDQPPAAPRRAAPVDSPVGVDRSEARRSRSRSARAADAGRRAHGPHARAHLSARRPARGRDSRQPAGREGGRGLHRAVPRAGHLPARLLPAQPALHLDGRIGERTEDARVRVGAQARRGGAARGARRRRRSSRASWSCRTSRWCASATGTRSSRSRRRRTSPRSPRSIWRYARALAFDQPRPDRRCGA